jgi:hypothetical protein
MLTYSAWQEWFRRLPHTILQQAEARAGPQNYSLYWYKSTSTDAEAGGAAASRNKTQGMRRGFLNTQVLSLLALLVQKYKY